MKRILFVDDEEMALKGLERLLRPMRGEWEMDFVNSGVKALDLMAIRPADVVVSDMRMPGMNGAELLNIIMQRHPRTVRLILSGFADRELILKCVGSTHQYLAKPCEPEALKMTLLRAARMDESLDSATLRQLVARCVNLPSVPAVYSQVVEALQDPNASILAIGEIVARDAAMAAMILKLVNSAYFGVGHRIANLGDAVTYLGTETIKSLLLFSHVFAQGARLAEDNLLVGPLWFHSFATANAAKMVVRCEGADRKLMDEAYVAGLLHDIGKLILVTNLPDPYNDVLALSRGEKLPLTAAERKIFGADHADVGGYLLGLWGLPVPVVEAIALHHKPETAVQMVFSPLAALHAGNILASFGRSPWAGLPASQFNLEYLSALKLDHRIDEWRETWRKHSVEAALAA
jgi:HD-like signal output (HDOD) protein